MKALVLSAPTMDLLGGTARPGGPPLYSGLAASRYGCSAAAAGPLGSEAPWLARVLRRAGVEFLGPLVAGPPYTFKLTVGGGERRVEPAGRPAIASLSPLSALKAVEAWEPQVVLAVPVGFEVPPDALAAVAARHTGLVAVDAQGYARSVGDAWPSLLPRGSYALLHYSADDTLPPEAPGGLAFETRGPRRGRVLLDGETIAWIPEPPRLLDDPTGAGDAFTAITACCMAEEWDPERCASLAVEMVPDVVEEAHAIVEEYKVGLG